MKYVSPNLEKITIPDDPVKAAELFCRLDKEDSEVLLLTSNGHFTPYFVGKYYPSNKLLELGHVPDEDGWTLEKVLFWEPESPTGLVLGERGEIDNPLSRTLKREVFLALSYSKSAESPELYRVKPRYSNPKTI